MISYVTDESPKFSPFTLSLLPPSHVYLNYLLRILQRKRITFLHSYEQHIKILLVQPTKQKLNH